MPADPDTDKIDRGCRTVNFFFFFLPNLRRPAWEQACVWRAAFPFNFFCGCCITANELDVRMTISLTSILWQLGGTAAHRPS